MRMLAKVPRIITSWLPRRAPYWLKSTAAPVVEQIMAGRARLADVAGGRDVVGGDRVEQERQRAAPTMSVTGFGSLAMPSK